MSNSGIDILPQLQLLLKGNRNCEIIQRFVSKENWSPQDRDSLLAALSDVLVTERTTADVAKLFRSLLLDLLHRARRKTRQNNDTDFPVHQKLCVALSHLVSISREVRCFAYDYLRQTKPFYRDETEMVEENRIMKKPRISEDCEIALTQKTVEAVYRLVRCFGQEISQEWNASDLLHHLSSTDVSTKWCVVHSVAHLLGMSAKRLNRWCCQLFTKEQRHAMYLRYDSTKKQCMESTSRLTNTDAVAKDSHLGSGYTKDCILGSDLSQDVISVCGVLLPVVPGTSRSSTHGHLTMVPSTSRNLQRLALAVSEGEPVFLEGPVGCGKTSLVEHLASLVRRTKSPQLLKLQLGEQTDSKALIGTYRCTDIPGQFLWQPGCLVSAVQEGYWLLLEDLDYAPMDVVSVLVPLLETGSLVLPGCTNKITAAPGFRIFATQRLVSSRSGWHRQQSCSNILERLWRRIRLEPLSRDELKEVISDRFPSFQELEIDNLLDVYFLLSSGQLDHTEVNENGRPISTRDLMKCCQRIAVDLNGVQPLAKKKTILVNALDCFASCLPLADGRMAVARAICKNIDVPEYEAENYYSSQRPMLKLSENMRKIGRVLLECSGSDLINSRTNRFAMTFQAHALLEQIGVCVRNNEPVLLVGETGTGKTSIVQYMADLMGQKLHVINMNQQSDMTDLLGGYKPVDLQIIMAPVLEEFEELHAQSFSTEKNREFFNKLEKQKREKRWKILLRVIDAICGQALDKCQTDMEPKKELHERWSAYRKRVLQLLNVVRHPDSRLLAFAFIEGILVKALKNGSWVLLDEINLATAETLECLSGLLESKSGSVVLTERGDTEPVERHPNFRLFACMNPAVDVGKKDLPLGIRNRFTEMFVDELEKDSELATLVKSYLMNLGEVVIQDTVSFYQEIRKMASTKLIDGTGHRPHYSLRTLCRALRQAVQNLSCDVSQSTSVRQHIYEAFRLSFLTQLDRPSYPIVDDLIKNRILRGNSKPKSASKDALKTPRGFVNVEGYIIAQGDATPFEPTDYIMTKSVLENLTDISRVVSAGKLPVLIQGETCVGKTSLITYLAKITGNTYYRINNHEHTDIQEYIGCYTADETGKLVFREGLLVEAMRKGYWIILDELNLAPTDVLEAVNRLLDDNRELFIPETQEVVQAHPRFILFATQNPPGLYGGRKVLSRAFRNRFVELHFDTIPNKELEEILHKRCQIAKSQAEKLVKVMSELQTKRRSSGLFAGKQGFITFRDLFRWAERYHLEANREPNKSFGWNQLLADNGYMLLAGRVRQPEEEQLVIQVIENNLKCKIDPDRLFSLTEKTPSEIRQILERFTVAPSAGFEHVVWTRAMSRMAVLVAQALKFKEPVLLVGETGCGKTTVCQVYAQTKGNGLHSVNCHLHSESSDFLGGLRPVRHKSENDPRLFEWCDGPLVTAMKEGSTFLIDEISLADDSVLERLNSVLETERTLLLVEKGSGPQNEVDKITAEPEFRVVATMNPGGDYGKKELSPALRNRFTEIWCPPTESREDLVKIIEHNLKPGIRLAQKDRRTSGFGSSMLDFTDWLQKQEFGRRCLLTIRDLLSWITFVNKTARVAKAMDAMETDLVEVDESTACHLDPAISYVHGAFLVFVDCLVGSARNSSSIGSSCLRFLMTQVTSLTNRTFQPSDFGMPDSATPNSSTWQMSLTDQLFGFHPFYIARGPMAHDVSEKNYAFGAPTTAQNALRVMRALQLARPILLEGSPGVGKTSLVAALAKASGHPLVRINLSEQTDVTDLFGADLPVEGGKGGEFAWRDGPFLSALKAGHWVVLDELNLASQSVLEGLNACFDHRAEVFIPELGMSFHVQHEKTRIFACQNPLNEGGGRKGLPKSFLNRFTQVYVDALAKEDLLFIAKTMHPQLGKHDEMLTQMVEFNQTLYQETVVEHGWGQKGGPWEFNLRDLFRWCDLMIEKQAEGAYEPDEFVHLLYISRMRTVEDRVRVLETFTKVFGRPVKENFASKQFSITHSYVQVGNSFLERREHCGKVDSLSNRQVLRLLHHSLAPLSALMKCIEMNWMTILIGNSCTGKTSLIELLARLTGTPLKILPMNSETDTTELLGGFEQANLKRRVEALDAEVKNLLQEVVARILSSGGSEGVDSSKRILDIWNEKPRLPSTGETLNDVTSDVELVLCRLKHLNRVIKFLKDFVQKNEILNNCSGELLQHEVSVTEIERLLQMDKTLNHGGRFEWIDSTLVHCLKEGNWLLIDNVNFCCASVLDRLNALVEPNGVLTISERGAIDGTVPSIKPHKNFRLILSMDPRHGEISRAMRNRGIEIYVPGENDGEGFDRFDMKAMLNDLGIVGRIPSDALISIHNSLCSQFGREEHFGIAQLLQSASLASQMMERGSSLATALETAFCDVYGQPANDRKRKLKIIELINRELPKALQTVNLPDTNSSGLTEAGLWPLVLPSVSDWADYPDLSAVRLSTTLILHLVDIITESTTQNHDLVIFDTLRSQVVTLPRERAKSMLYAAGKLLLEGCSTEGLPLLIRYLKQTVKESETARESVGDGATGRLALVQGVVDALEIVQNHHITEMLKAEMEQLPKIEGIEAWSQLPVDWRWNEFMARLIRVSSIRSKQNVTDEKWNYLAGLNNQLYLVYQITQMRSTLEDHLKAEAEKVRTSFLKMSLDHQSGKLDAEDLPDESLKFVAPVVSLFLSEVLLELQTPQPFSDAQMQEVMNGLQWLKRFVVICCQPIEKQTMESQLSDVALHWNWLSKQLISLLASHGLSFPKDLQFFIYQLDKRFGADSSAYNVAEVIRSRCGHVMPFRTETEAVQCLKIEAISDCADLCARLNQNNEEVIPLMKFTSNERIGVFRFEIVRALSNVHWAATSDLTEILLTASNNLEGFLEKTGFRWVSVARCGNTGSLEPITESVGDINSVENARINLWPIFGLLAAMEEGHLVTKRLMTSEDVSVDFESLVRFACHRTALPATTLVPMTLVDVAESCKVFDSLVMNFLSHLKSNEICLNKCLLWKPDVDQIVPDRIANSVFCASLSYAVFNLLTRDKDVTSMKPVNQSRGSSGSAWLVGNCSLCEGHERQGQMVALNATLWTHLSLIGGNRWNHRGNSLRLLEAVTDRLVASVQSFLPSGLESLSLDDSLHLLDENMSCSQSQLSLLLPDWNNYLYISLGRMEELREQDLEHWRTVMMLGEAWARIGVLQAHLQAPQGPTDPNQKLAYELQHTREEFEDVKEELDVRRWYSSIVYGSDCNYLHPVVQGLVERQRSLEGWIEENCGKVAYRPLSSQFLSLLKEARRHLTHDVSSVDHLVRRLWSAFENLDKIGSVNIVNDVDAYSRKCETVIDRLQRTYPVYRDVLSNFICALRQIQFGLDSMAQAVRAKSVESRSWYVMPSQDSASLEEIVGLLASFPSINERIPSTIDLVERLLSKEVMETVFHLKSLTLTNSSMLERPSVLPRLIQIALLHLSNAAASVGSLDRSMVRMFEVIFKHYVTSWRAAEDERQKKEEEDASLFEYIGDTLTEEEKDELEIKARFPSFETDFDDIRFAQSLTNTVNTPVTTNKAHDIRGVTDQEMENVAAVHQSIFIKLTESSWHQVAHESLKNDVNRLLPVLQSYEIAADIVKTNAAQQSLELEGKLLGGHLLASAVSCGTDLPLEVNHQEVVTSGTDPVLWTPSRPYDIYCDANVEKVLACCPVLDKLLARINELLLDWPENPTLEMLATIVSRIKSFPVTSSLMRFTTGLEMLLESAQEWQKNAASRVSLAANLEEVTQLIIEWRKLELNCWKACLDVVAYKAHQRASRWWFHIYKLVEPYLQLQEPRPEEEETLSDLRKALNEFLESSPAGEYVSRLQIVLAFHCHLLHTEPSLHLGRIQSIFWNVCQFYKQFLPNVQGFLTKSRTPIEKELKDYVRIARWDDKNFYHVQSAVYKSHKTLHRHMKQFERILRTSVSAILTENNSANEASPSQNGSSDSAPDIPVNVSHFIVSTSSLTAGVISKVSRKSRLMINFCRRIMSKMPYERLVSILDDFTGSVIEGVRQLQSLNINHITDKEKQRSEVKHICQRKKMALTDLFRQLKTMGLSYQKGLVEINASDENRFLLDWFSQRPCDVKVALSQLPADQCDSVTSAAWHGCDKYLVRALNRRTLFHSALLTPSKELGMNVIERSKGFSEHLSLEVENQRRHLVTKIYDFVRLRKQMQKLSSLKQSCCVVLPPQDDARTWQERLKSLLERVLEFVHQLKLLLHCAPSVEQDLHQMSPVAGACLPLMATACRGDKVWSEGVTQLKDCEEILCKTLGRVRAQLKSHTFVTMEDVNSIRGGIESLKQATDCLSCVKMLLCLPSSENHGIAASIIYNISEIHKFALNFDRFLDVELNSRQTIDDIHEIEKQAENDPVLSEFLQKVDRAMCKSLKVVEEFLKKANLEKDSLEKKDLLENSSEEHLDGEEAEDDDTETEGLLTTKIGKTLTEDIDALNLDQVNQCLEDLISSIMAWSNHPEYVQKTHLAVHHLADHLPIFEQYVHLVQYLLTQRIAGLRASTKLLTILLEVFRSLAQKGFCLPEGFSDEMAQEGATEFEDMEGGGIGEGEGVKDVSDQIDNEGQVEGLEQDKKEDANDQNLPDIASEDNAIEMSEDIDGKTHDLEKNGEEDEENEKDKNEEEMELDRKMGDLGEEDVDKLDEKLWGSDEEEQAEEQEKKDEFGKGDGEQSKSELGAKDDRCQDAPDDKKERQNEDDVESPPDFDDDDGAEDEHLNQPRSDVHAPEDEEEEPMELPDDLNLDGGDDKDQEEGANQDAEAEEINVEEPINAEDESMKDVPKDVEDAAEEDEVKESEKEEDAKKEQPQEPNKEEEEQTREQEQEEGHADTEANAAEDQMDENQDQDQKPPLHQPGYDAKENNDEEAKNEEKVTQDEEESTRKTEHGTVDVQEMEGVKDTAGVSDETKKEENTAGAIMSEETKGEEGGESEMVAQGGSKKRKKKNKKKRRRQEQVSNDRSLGTKSEPERNLKTIENTTNESDEKQEPQTSDVYEHIKDAASQSDAQTLDAATEDQLRQQQQLMKTDEPEKDEDIDEEIPMEVDEEDDEPKPETKAKAAQKLSQTETKESGEKNKEKDLKSETKVEVSGDRIETATVARSLKPSVHTVMENYSVSESRELAVENLRKILEREREDLYLIPDSVEQERKAEVLWQQCESLTSQLSQELCEQLRLILEPTQASKLRGDYRTGRRINMRKVIPYVASQFRKDKIWLRRTKPSKRQYQVLIAIDDSQSMEYNDSRQLAYESLAIISNALMKLEVGDLSVCSFGESVRVLHPFKEPFSAQSGAKIIQQLQFQQNHTQVIELLEAAARIFGDMRQRISGDFQNSNTAQLLLIVSDGRLSQADPLVKDAIQILREANIFVLFVVLDSPVYEDSPTELDVSGKPVKQYKKGSVLDIISADVVETDNGKQVVIRTFVETFPFPFYIILRDVHTLPQTLSDALRQWFELVTASDL